MGNLTFHSLSSRRSRRPTPPRAATRARSIALLLAAASAFGCASGAPSAPGNVSEPHRPAVSSPIVARLSGFEARPGLLALHVDADAGKVLAVLPRPDRDGVLGEYIYYEGIVTGLGSNPIGLDRGQIGEPRVVRLRAIGNRVLFEVVNTGFRALSENQDERIAVRDSFAGGILV